MEYFRSEEDFTEKNYVNKKDLRDKAVSPVGIWRKNIPERRDHRYGSPVWEGVWFVSRTALARRSVLLEYNEQSWQRPDLS